MATFQDLHKRCLCSEMLDSTPPTNLYPSIQYILHLCICSMQVKIVSVRNKRSGAKTLEWLPWWNGVLVERRSVEPYGLRNEWNWRNVGFDLIIRHWNFEPCFGNSTRHCFKINLNLLLEDYMHHRVLYSEYNSYS